MLNFIHAPSNDSSFADRFWVHDYNNIDEKDAENSLYVYTYW